LSRVQISFRVTAKPSRVVVSNVIVNVSPASAKFLRMFLPTSPGEDRPLPVMRYYSCLFEPVILVKRPASILRIGPPQESRP
jgi:hypothetical protein